METLAIFIVALILVVLLDSIKKSPQEEIKLKDLRTFGRKETH